MQEFLGKRKIDAWRGKDYSAYSIFQRERGLKFVNEHLDKNSLPDNFYCLDIGCGDAYILKQVAKRYKNGTFIGIDPSESMIKQALEEPLLPNIQIKLADANKLPCEDHSIDMAWATFVLQWVENKRRACQEIARILKPGGKFFSITPCFHEYIDNLREEMTKEEKWAPYFIDFKDPIVITRNSKPEIYKEVYSEANLILEGFEISTTPLKFSRENLTKFLTIITPHLSVFEKPEDKDRFMEENVSRYLTKYPPLPDGTCVISFDFLEVAAHSAIPKLQNTLKAKL